MAQQATLVLVSMNDVFERKQITVPFYPEHLVLGRQFNEATTATPSNGYFDSKILSKNHSEVWAEQDGSVWIRDNKSTNGTYVNSQRLSAENRRSEPHELRQGDILELGIDILSETSSHYKVAAKVEFAGLSGSTNRVSES